MVLKSGASPSSEPHQLDIALGLTLKATARLHAVEVAVKVDLQQRGGMVRRPPGHRRLNASKAQRSKIEFVDESFDDPDGIIFSDVIVQRSWQKPRLPAVLTFNEA